MSTDSTGHQKYYVPEKSSIPIVFAVAMLFFGFGAADAVMGKGTTMFFFGITIEIEFSSTYLVIIGFNADKISLVLFIFILFNSS